MPQAPTHLSLTSQTAPPAAHDAATQTDEAMQTLERQLGQAGAHPRHIRKLTTYVTDRAWLAPVDAVIRRHLGDLAPARVTLIVSGLATPEMLVALEIEAVIAP